MTPFEEADRRLGGMHGYEPVEVRPYRCPFCGARSGWGVEHVAHVQTHLKPVLPDA